MTIRQKKEPTKFKSIFAHLFLWQHVLGPHLYMQWIESARSDIVQLQMEMLHNFPSICIHPQLSAARQDKKKTGSKHIFFPLHCMCAYLCVSYTFIVVVVLSVTLLWFFSPRIFRKLLLLFSCHFHHSYYKRPSIFVLYGFFFVHRFSNSVVVILPLFRMENSPVHGSL